MEQLIQVEKVHLCHDFILKPAAIQTASLCFLCRHPRQIYTHKDQIPNLGGPEVAPNITSLLPTTVFAHNEQTNETTESKASRQTTKQNTNCAARLLIEFSFLRCVHVEAVYFRSLGLGACGSREDRGTHVQSIIHQNSSKFIKIHQNSSK